MGCFEDILWNFYVRLISHSSARCSSVKKIEALQDLLYHSKSPRRRFADSPGEASGSRQSTTCRSGTQLDFFLQHLPVLLQPRLCFFHRGRIRADDTPKAGRVVRFNKVSEFMDYHVIDHEHGSFDKAPV